MSAWLRFGYGLMATVGLAVGGLIYQQVFVAELLPIAPTEGPFATPVIWLDRLVPVILVGLLLFVWAWVIAGSVQEERTLDRRRVR
ncbi:uncharacterized protein NP_7030A (plasmid) [Natronomonas pharaonis DSM 2160]|uniref:Uncharacterized protein n=1 Tax=Natronomonas pharaonis (strain ATCC 35678 / DSM 2160 / CIP 103997 / JCM 8858 / NBRC 14720 / NCIMB 2260 / Gabara) TaxID=348780 RepID=Q3ILT9_NATPD|nr:hypothetical protein [Natronomonas pharaonis]CAI49744.1 uncharacterized protein NP_3306A [Natronomonas pharaonis DSM 2160]CAI50931.1 uncharacterized protein NP_7030A [Natronomonas pharaonis DSM 2160]